MSKSIIVCFIQLQLKKSVQSKLEYWIRSCFEFSTLYLTIEMSNEIKFLIMNSFIHTCQECLSSFDCKLSLETSVILKPKGWFSLVHKHNKYMQTQQSDVRQHLLLTKGTNGNYQHHTASDTAPVYVNLHLWLCANVKKP